MTAPQALGGLQGNATQTSDQRFDLRSGALRVPRQVAYFICDHGETTAMLTGTRSLDGRVKRQQIRLLGHRLDHVQHTAMAALSVSSNCMDSAQPVISNAR